MMHFCSLWDQNYHIKGMALYESLMTHAPESKLHILAMDSNAYGMVRDLKGVEAVPLQEFEFKTLGLTEARLNRTWQEFCWTCASVWLRECSYQFDPIVYLDADSFILSCPSEVYWKYSKFGVALTPHRFAEEHKAQFLPNGFYNVNWIELSGQGIGFAEEWAGLCLGWCYGRHERDLFADQKYLDTLGPRHHSIDINEPGVNLAPWNQAQYNYSVIDDQLCIDGKPIVCYHTHESILGKDGSLLRKTNWKLHPMVEDFVYSRYETLTKEIARNL